MQAIEDVCADKTLAIHIASAPNALFGVYAEQPTGTSGFAVSPPPSVGVIAKNKRVPPPSVGVTTENERVPPLSVGVTAKNKRVEDTERDRNKRRPAEPVVEENHSRRINRDSPLLMVDVLQKSSGEHDSPEKDGTPVHGDGVNQNPVERGQWSDWWH